MAIRYTHDIKQVIKKARQPGVTQPDRVN